MISQAAGTSLITVGVGDMKLSDDPQTTLVTYSLGSCLGIAVYDPLVHVGGLLHVMLPHAGDERGRQGFNPYKYVDTGIPLLFKGAYQLGAEKKRMRVSVAGGSQIMDESGYFNIGKRNLAELRKMFWKNGVMVDKEHVEGSISRTVRLTVADGRISIWMGRGKEVIL